MTGRLLVWMAGFCAWFSLHAQVETVKSKYSQLESSVPTGTYSKDSVLHFFKLADQYMELDRYDSAEYWLGKVGERLEYKKPGIFSYYFHSRQAEVFYYNNLLQLGLQQANRALQIALHLNDSLFIADSYNFLGLFSLNLEKYKDAEKYLLKGLSFFNHSVKDTPIIVLSEEYHLHGNLGEVYTKLKAYDKALLHFDRSRIEAERCSAYRAVGLALISAGDAYLETGTYQAAKDSLIKGIQISMNNQDNDVALFGYGILALLYTKFGNVNGTYDCINRGNYLKSTQPGLNPYYSLLYMRKVADALLLLKDFRGVSNVQHEILQTEQEVRRKNNLMIEDVLSTGLKNENRLLQLEVEEARQKQRTGNIRVVLLLLVIGILLLAGFYYRNSIRQKLVVAGIREKISQNLHDDIGASISSLHIYSSIAQDSLLKQPEKTRDLLERITQQSKILMENMSDMVWSMKGHGDEGMTLGTRIKNFGAELLTVQNILVKYEIDEDAFSLFTSFESRKNILLILKEAMNNIAKYSMATQAIIKLQKQNDAVMLGITDNGVGFDEKAIQMGNGLRNIYLRVNELKGNIVISSAPGKGTQLLAYLPIP